MRINDLPHEKIERLSASLAPSLRLLNRLIQRMDRRGFDPTDRFYQSVLRTRNDVHELIVMLHYATCEGNGGGYFDTPAPGSNCGEKK